MSTPIEAANSPLATSGLVGEGALAGETLYQLVLGAVPADALRVHEIALGYIAEIRELLDTLEGESR